MCAAASTDSTITIYLPHERLQALSIVDGEIYSKQSNDPMSGSLKGRLIRVYPSCQESVMCVPEGNRIRRITVPLFQVMACQPLVVGQTVELSTSELDLHRIQAPHSQNKGYKELLFETEQTHEERYRVTPWRKEAIRLETFGLSFSKTQPLSRHRFELLLLRRGPETEPVYTTTSALPQFFLTRFGIDQTRAAEGIYLVTPL